MNRYFTNRSGAVQRLMAMKRDSDRMRSAPTIVGMRTNGSEVQGLDQVLLDVRAGRMDCFVCTHAFVEDVVFIT